jgi:hypothetical protein
LVELPTWSVLEARCDWISENSRCRSHPWACSGQTTLIRASTRHASGLPTYACACVRACVRVRARVCASACVLIRR